ncbi:heavy metal translocating P-type ATPase [Aquamicrobium terrae]|uniref:P-type Zn(2+) transporter n=1 Tax=Aquamicrobium terrae TaxID=1324945 RepID=A0ABV2MZG1_9HYPH
MTQPGTAGVSKAEAFVFRVEGMDCASCAGTITTALGHLPGVSEVSVSVTRETMALSLDAAQTPVDAIEKAVRKLGFVPTLLDAKAKAGRSAPAHDHDHGHNHRDHDHGHACRHDHGHEAPAAPAKAQKPWWQSVKSRHAAIGLVLIALSFAAEFFWPRSSRYVFSFTTLVLVAPIARRALAAARMGAPFTIQMLMSVAAIGALIIGAVEEAAVVVLLFLVGEVLEGLAAARARSGIKALGSLIPRTAMVEEGGSLREVPTDQLAVGQTVVCRPGDRIPADGTVVAGMSSVDESPMTGESVPVAKQEGSAVFAGSINHDGSLRIRVERAASDNTIARIIALVEDAQEAKAPTERFIDRFSRVYMPVIVALSVLVAVVPPLAGFGSWDEWIYRGLALLLIGCPCALVISVPAAIASGLSAGARQGMLIKGGAVIETLAGAQTVAFDKTGTLTLGKPKVTDVVAADGDAARLIAIAAAVERESSHPLATAIVDHAAESAAPALAGGDIRAIAGRGMEGRVGGQAIFIGAPRFAGEAGTVSDDLIRSATALESDGKTVAVVIADGNAIGLVAMRDEPRPDAAEGIGRLRQLGVDSVMLTGDNARTGTAIARQLGMQVRAELLPQDKVGEIRKLAAGRQVVMIGDGINDAPALAAASVGVAIGSGTDVAMETADAALMGSRINDVAGMIRLARATMRNIRQNVAIALGLKAVFLITTVTGLSGLWIAVLADTGATVLVTLNAMRLLAFRPGRP